MHELLEEASKNDSKSLLKKIQSIKKGLAKFEFICEIFSMLEGELLCPGDKSISQRVLIIGSYLNQEIFISNILSSSDPICTANALNQVNANLIFNKSSNTVKTVKRKIPFQDPTESLDLGNSGTGARLLVGFLSGLGINATITGDKSLSSKANEANC